MKNVLDYLTWEHVELGVRITGCDNRFEGALEIPSLIDGIPVVEIGRKAFWKCKSIVSVEIPDTVEVVGRAAFRGCVGLEELRLGEGIKTIEKDAFRNCSSLRRVVLPSTLEALAPDAFDECVDLLVDDER